MALFSENYGTIRVRKWLFNRGYRCNTHSDPKNPLDQVFEHNIIYRVCNYHIYILTFIFGGKDTNNKSNGQIFLHILSKKALSRQSHSSTAFFLQYFYLNSAI